MSQQGEFKDPFNFKYFLVFLIVFAGVGCLNGILGWYKLLSV